MLYQDACSVVGLLLARGELRFPTTGFGQVPRRTKYKVEFPPCHLATWQHGRKLYALFWPGRWNQSGVVWLKIQAEGTTPAPTPMAVNMNTEQTQFSIFCTGFEDKESTFPALLTQLAFSLMLVSYGQSPTYVQDARSINVKIAQAMWSTSSM